MAGAAAGGKKKRPADEPAKDWEKTLGPVRKLATVLREDPIEKKTPSDLGFSNLFEVTDQTPQQVQATIEKVAAEAIDEVLEGNGLRYALAQRGTGGTTVYVKELDRNYLEYKQMMREFSDASQVKRTTMMTRLMQLVREMCVKGIHSTKRDLFYADVKLFEKQTNSDNILEELSVMFGCTRQSLMVTASEKGVVVGRIQFDDDDDVIDCTKMGRSGKNIPSYIDRVSNIRSDFERPAEFILLVEKDAAFQRLAEDRFYNTYPCIIITGKGEADLATRMFLRRVKEALQIPILGLFDSDAHGLKILSVYMQGSEAQAHDAANLATPDIKWLGVRPSDLDKYNIPADCRLDLTPHDVAFAESLLQKPYIMNRPKWVEELKTMLFQKEKAEIQAFTSKGFQFLTETYLPRKLREGDWV